MSKIAIRIYKFGRHLYAYNLCDNPEPILVYPTTTLKKEKFLVEPGGRAYLQARVDNGNIFVDILRTSDDGNICHKTISGHEDIIEFDPWDRV